MSGTDLADALTREHHEIDSGIDAYMGTLDSSDAAPSTDLLLAALQALRRHIYLEEIFLFPPLQAAGMMMPIQVMLREHGALWLAMDELDAALAAGEAPGAMRERCLALLSLLESHNSKEEPIVYPRADADLAAEQRTVLADFIDSGRIPKGWVCQKAPA